MEERIRARRKATVKTTGKRDSGWGVFDTESSTAQNNRSGFRACLRGEKMGSSKKKSGGVGPKNSGS